MRQFLFLVALTVSTQANALTFTDRDSFESSLTNLIVDDYENPAYQYIQSNSQMSSVRNETEYKATGHGPAQPNLVFGFKRQPQVLWRVQWFISVGFCNDFDFGE
jgi:hypothetical protein